MIMWYIDESGITKSERRLVVGGYCIHDKDYNLIIEKFRELKRKHFPESPDRKIDMKGLLQGQGWLRRVKIDNRINFLEDFYKFIEESNMRIAICYVDKDNSEKIRNKMQFAYECLFERICLNVEDISEKQKEKEIGILFTDSMTNLNQVKKWFETFYSTGTQYVSNTNMVEAVVPLKMSQSEMLQISDLVVCTCPYWLKSNDGQRSIKWAKDVLTKGWKIFLNKERKVPTQDKKREISSIYFYSRI